MTDDDLLWAHASAAFRLAQFVCRDRVDLRWKRDEMMEMPWADLYGISQAIPPAYTEHIGRQLMDHLDSAVPLYDGMADSAEAAA